MYFLTVPETEKFKIKVPVWSVSVRVISLDCKSATFSLGPPMAFPWSMRAESELILSSSFYKATNPSNEDPTFITSFNFTYQPKYNPMAGYVINV